MLRLAHVNVIQLLLIAILHVQISTQKNALVLAILTRILVIRMMQNQFFTLRLAHVNVIPSQKIAILFSQYSILLSANVNVT
jgi:hypothetical protein